MKQINNQKEYQTRDEFDQFTLHLDEEEGTIFKKREEKKPIKPNVWKYLGLASDLGFMIAVPIAGGALIGYTIDKKWSTYPHATRILLLIGIVISIAGFIKTIKELMEKKN